MSPKPLLACPVRLQPAALMTGSHMTLPDKGQPQRRALVNKADDWQFT